MALEGMIYWADIKRWELGPTLYPMEIRGIDAGLVEIRYPNGYNLPKDRYLATPDFEDLKTPTWSETQVGKNNDK